MATVTGSVLKLQHRINCLSSGIVYCYTCLRCSEQNICQMTNQLKDRFLGHMEDIRNADGIGLGAHFREEPYQNTAIMISLLEKINGRQETC